MSESSLVPAKRKRVDFTAEEKIVLEEAWQNGMRKVGKDPKIEETAILLNSPKERIEHDNSNNRGAILLTFMIDAEHRMTDVMVKNLKESQELGDQTVQKNKQKSQKQGKRKVNKTSKTTRKIKKQEIDDGNIYQIERLLATKMENGNWLFELKWSSYQETTWEPEVNIHKTVVKQFLKTSSV